MDFRKRSAELATRIAAARAKHRRGKAYPLDLRRDIDAFVREATARGRSLCAIARDLGLSQTTLCRWHRQARRDPGLPHLRPVTLLPSPPLLPGPVSVHGPAGIRIEGLDLDGVAELIRRLT